MTIGRVGLALVLVAMLGVATVPAGAAQSSCPSGFTLTTGGVAAADLNGDGSTCERTTTSADGSTVLEAVDNVQAAAAGTGCPPGFTPTTTPPKVAVGASDRNGDGIVCYMVTASGRVVIVDNNLPFDR